MASKVSGLTGELERVQSVVEELGGKVHAMHGQQQGSIEAEKSTLAVLEVQQQKVDALEATKAQLSEQREGVAAKMDSLEAEKSTLTAQCAQLDKNNGALKQQISLTA